MSYQALTLLLFVVIEQAKFKIVDLAFSIEINLVEKKLVVIKV